MIKVYFEMNNSKYSELAAIFYTEELYLLCLPQLEAEAKKGNFNCITESITETNIVSNTQ